MEGLERIKVLASEIKDKPLLKIVDYLISRKDMNDKYLNEEKTLKQMIIYIKSQAKKEEVDGVALIEDEKVFGWAIHYFDEPNNKLDLSIKDNTIKEKASKITTEATPTRRLKKKNYKPEGQLSLFDFECM